MYIYLEFYPLVFILKVETQENCFIFKTLNRNARSINFGIFSTYVKIQHLCDKQNNDTPKLSTF